MVSNVPTILRVSGIWSALLREDQALSPRRGNQPQSLYLYQPTQPIRSVRIDKPLQLHNSFHYH